ncbi:MAG: pro-sigmaK processing inhibitor BofA family protein [Clostridia bacterium]|nr:pro-sigmaK processing inhibitor BofA family protein [Clostridia bacterium]
MEIYIFAGFCLLAGLLVFKISKHFFKALAVSAFGGIGAVCAVCAISYFLPVSLSLNWLSLGLSAVFSVPGVILMLMLESFVL